MASQDRISQLFRLDGKVALVTGASAYCSGGVYRVDGGYSTN